MSGPKAVCQPRDSNQSRAVCSRVVSEVLFIVSLLRTLDALYLPVKVRNIFPVLSFSVRFVFLFDLQFCLQGAYLPPVLENRVIGKLQKTVQKLNPVFHLPN